ncbi:MAG: DUF4136 domain-containing protein [Acidobacteriia bacterium]|nr:DUF4136 domain-containing protein [Terriglobia bacterium]
MRSLRISTCCIALLVAMAAGATAQQVQTDFDKHVNFAQYKTYSWKKVRVSNSLWEPRIKDAIDSQLAAKGWKQVDDGGDVVLLAIGTTRTERTLDTFYNGFGGGWRWRGAGGFGEATTTEHDYKEGTLVVDMFDAKSKQLIWRGDAEDMLSGNPDKNEKKLDKAVVKMFKKFPPQAKA